jgi:hypothetical protein
VTRALLIVAALVAVFYVGLALFADHLERRGGNS